MTDVLVSTAWVEERLGEAGIRLIEVSASPDAYEGGHLPGAVVIDWRRELIEEEDESSGLVIDQERFGALARKLGLLPEETLIFYGDQGGRHACRALWTFEYYRHVGALHLMDGGREVWQREGRPLTQERPNVTPSGYPAPSKRNNGIRATRQEIESRLGGDGFSVVDTRTRGEYEGTDVRAERGGRIPGARHIFWKDAVAEDGSFKSKEELVALYAEVAREGTVTAHCQLGMRSAHTWFVLRHILGYADVRNYDGSWQEWGNLSDTPIEG